MLLAKLLFVVAAIQAPLLVVDVAEGLTSGFPFVLSLGAAVSENLHFLIGFSIPVLAFVSLTRTLTEAIIAGLTIFAGVIAFGMMMAGVHGGNPFGPTNNSTIQWIPEATRYIIYLLGAAAVLVLQYFHRKTLPSRYAFAGMVLVCFGTELVPWNSAFALQESFSVQPGLGNHVAIAFEPDLGQFQAPSHVDLQASPNKTIREARASATNLYVPLRITGLPDGSILKVDRSVARIVRTNGIAENPGIPNDLGDDLEVDNDGQGKTAILTHQSVRMRGDIYDRVRNDDVRLDIDYSLTLMKLSGTHTLAALDGEERVADIGWCKTKLNESATAVQLSCLEAGKPPSQCASLFLENSTTGSRNPPRSGCGPDYQPYFGQYDPIDIVSRVVATLPFHDPTGLAKYPVDGSQLAQARVVIKSYTVQDHFSRRLVVPDIRLSDWMPR